MGETDAQDGRRRPDLRSMTDARVSLGRHGGGLPTQAQLSFLLDHARAREAVWANVDWTVLTERLEQAGLAVVQVESLAENRSIYVRRPDLGRLLSEGAEKRLREIAAWGAYDIAIVVADGLSSIAVDINAVPLIAALIPKLAGLGLQSAPVVLASQARVAIGDPVGRAIGAKLSIVLVGERPGLSAADSLGAYVTLDPNPGTRDSSRNCVSNIRDGGLPIHQAADTIASLVHDIVRTNIGGVGLKAAVSKRISPAMGAFRDISDAAPKKP
ncbi:ethanolamine ammonia-lyase subunit EutC [Rhizobium sp. Leaf341]|uniref:ethanolamine ammonia-lyase subunit EutC n=1 Tax=Rhizobium sp. Leaf341 TaxID=1736344 RepID=UPI0007136404|nr:ethanolamine ammonia-lyase subunit EutC [Rhizobium sp. Leaf341]KQR71566.1 ethanolamine ammonia-lyase [Rhizobium sp. Leaf341]